MTALAVLAGSGHERAPSSQSIVLALKDPEVHEVDYNLAVRPGIPVRLTIVNPTRETHTFTVPELGINQIVPPALAGTPIRVVVTFTAPYGALHWECEPCHGEMSGTIYGVITPRSPEGYPPGGFHWDQPV